MQTESAKTIVNLVDDFNTAMLVTQTPAGQLRSRPMMIAGQRDDGTLYFVTSTDTSKTDEMEDNPSVNVSMQSAGRYVSLSGRASVVDDDDLVDELWSPTWEVWFPKGKDDPNLVVAQIETTIGEYWDNTGADTLRFIYEAGKAWVKGETIDEEKIGDHATTLMN